MNSVRLPKIRLVKRETRDTENNLCYVIPLRRGSLILSAFFILNTITQLILQWLKFANVIDMVPHWIIVFAAGNGDFSYLPALVAMSLYFVAFIVWDSFGFFTLFKKQAGPVNKFTLGQTIFLGFETFGQLFMMLDFYRSLSYEKEIINTDKNDLTVWTPAIIGWHVMVGVNTIVSILFLSILWKLTRKLQREEYLDKQQTADGEDYIKQFETVVIEGDGDTKDVKDVKDIEKPEMAKEKMTI